MKNLVCFFSMLLALGPRITCCDVGHEGCPDVTVKQDFDISKYMGLWYEIEKIPVVFENGLKCITAFYEDKEEYIKVTNGGIKEDGEASHVVGKATTPNCSEPAKLVVKFDRMPFGSRYWILDTDYKEYSIVYSCNSQHTTSYSELVWILGRNAVLDKEVKERIYKFLDDKKITRSRLEATLQNC